MVGAEQTQVFRVTGIASSRASVRTTALVWAAIVTMGGLTTPRSKLRSRTNIAMQLRVSREEFFASFPEFGDVPPRAEYVPAAIVNVARIRTIPFLLAAVLAALALLTVSHGMLTSMRTRRRDLAILRSLGADRGWITPSGALAGDAADRAAGRDRHPARHRRRTARVRARSPTAWAPSTTRRSLFSIVAVGSVVVVVVANAIAAVVSRAPRRRTSRRCYFRASSARRAACQPHMPCTPAPGGVDAEQRNSDGFGVSYGSSGDRRAEDQLQAAVRAAGDVAADVVGVVLRGDPAAW